MNQNIITVEVWSDVVCPFCLLGKKKLERAVEKLEVQDQVEITFRSFQLDPNFPEDSSLLSKINLVQRKGYPTTQVEGMCNQLTISGKEYDIQFDFDKAHTFNTLSAHRLIHWAKQYEKANDLKEAFMVAHFSKGVDLANKELLLNVVEQVGLDRKKAEGILASDSFLSEVQNDLTKANQLGIRGVPFFLINGQETISGAQSDAVFERALKAEISKLTASSDTTSSGVCTPDKACD